MSGKSVLSCNMWYRPSGITTKDIQCITKTVILHNFYRYITKGIMDDFEYMIHMYMNENETKTDWDTLDKLLQECPDITSPAMVEDFGN